VNLASSDLPVPERALAVGAHPDDIEFGAGATLARWAAGGCEVSYAICTDGSKGTWDPDVDVQALVATRQTEARAAAKALGATGEVVHLGRVDGELADDRETESDLARWIRVLRPDVLLGHDPWRRYRLHPDHRAAGFLTIGALVAARDPHFFREHGLPPHRPGALLLFEADEPDHVEAADEPWLAAKIAALEAHESQYQSTMFITAEDEGTERARFHQRIRTQLEDAARSAARDGLAEVFKLVPTDR
jgi:LmbE family N-acetylglucosaminyl deacetylase